MDLDEELAMVAADFALFSPSLLQLHDKRDRCSGGLFSIYFFLFCFLKNLKIYIYYVMSILNLYVCSIPLCGRKD